VSQCEHTTLQTRQDSRIPRGEPARETQGGVAWLGGLPIIVSVPAVTAVVVTTAVVPIPVAGSVVVTVTIAITSPRGASVSVDGIAVSFSVIVPTLPRLPSKPG
jgi:hypothetical protein